MLQSHEAHDEDQVQAVGLSVEVDDPVHGTTRQVGPTIRLHGSPPAAVQGPQPAVDQHHDELLGGLAGRDRRATAVRPAKRALANALDGIKVLDLGNFLAGPFGPMLLGDLGATVYKLESPQGDQMRPITEPFNGCQRGKLDVVADLKTPEGLEICHRLMREVDVIHHNMRPGVAERLGVDEATARAMNPTVIYCHTTMWGSEGPRASWPGFDQLGQSSSRLRVRDRWRRQPAGLVPVRHVRPDVRLPVGRRRPVGVVLARAHRTGSVRRHVDHQRRDLHQLRRVDRARRAPRAPPRSMPTRPASGRCTACTGRATAGSRWP